MGGAHDVTSATFEPANVGDRRCFLTVIGCAVSFLAGVLFTLGVTFSSTDAGMGGFVQKSEESYLLSLRAKISLAPRSSSDWCPPSRGLRPVLDSALRHAHAAIVRDEARLTWHKLSPVERFQNSFGGPDQKMADRIIQAADNKASRTSAHNISYILNSCTL